MYSLSKKKSKLSPAEKNINKKVNHSRNKSRTENSPTEKVSLSKQQIKNTIKKIVYQQSSTAMRPLQIKQQQKSSHETKHHHMEISIPKFRSSLTPKGFNNTSTRPQYRDRQVRSTKAADNSKMFTSSGRYDFKQLFENKNYSQLKDSARQKQQSQTNSGHQITNQMSRNHDRKIQQTTLKFQRENQFDVQSVLTAQQFQKFGDRFPQKFKRAALLGRGGFSVVWLGIHRSSKRKVAIKQILTKNPHQTHLKEIWFGSYFFEKGGDPRQQFQNHIGINNICKLYSYEIKTIDSWLYYQLCQQSLGGSLFQLKTQTCNGQKSYRIYYKQLVQRMRQNLQQLKTLIIQVAKALYLINSHNIVHSDLKTENILLRVKRKQDGSGSAYIKSLKLIDFGSSFLFTNLKQFSMATPQYMPPQILNYILFQNKLEYDVLMLNKMQKYKNPWIIDIWSLGCIILEIVTGVPLWMSISTRIQDTGIKATGLFAVKGRIFQKIIEKQIQVVRNLDYYLQECNHSGIIVDKKILQVLKKMLSLEPELRISPFQILNLFGVQCQPQKIPFY